MRKGDFLLWTGKMDKSPLEIQKGCDLRCAFAEADGIWRWVTKFLLCLQKNFTLRS
jgi:hypothetical protein